MRFISKLFLLSILFIAYNAGFARQTDGQLPDNERSIAAQQETLSDYLNYAVANSSALKAAYNEWVASAEQIEIVKSLPDPMLEYRYFIDEVETRVGPQKHSIGISQAFPWFGELELRGDAESEAASAAAKKYEALKLELLHEVSSAYYEYFYVEKAVDIARANVELLKYIENIALSLYRTGENSRGDLIQAQVETLKLDDMLSELIEKRAVVLARFNTLLEREADEPVTAPKALKLYDVNIPDRQIISIAKTNNPQIASLGFLMTEAQKRVEVAKTDYYPDFRIGLSYIDTGDSIYSNPSDNGKDPIIASVSLTIPLWQNKYSAGERRARNRYFAAANRQNSALSRLEYDVKSALYDYNNAARKIDLYSRSLLPQASQSLKVLEQEFRAGSRDFTDLVDSQRVLLEFMLAYNRAVADKANAVSKIRTLAGGVLELKESEISSGIDEDMLKLSADVQNGDYDDEK
jgi:outer membrane protein TolC